jgi:KUP system potassium uptake protein
MAQGVPLPLTHNMRLNHVLHERVLLVAVEMAEEPRLDDARRIIVRSIADHILRVELKFGFMEKPDVPMGLRAAIARKQLSACELAQVTYYTGHETIIPTDRDSGMARWRKSIFALMHHNAQRPGAYFNIPSMQVMEIGVEFEI